MKKVLSILLLAACTGSFVAVNGQKSLPGSGFITAGDLESHMKFLASPYMGGRENGSKELSIAAGYIESQARLIGLKPANGTSYLQSYQIVKTITDKEKSGIEITDPEGKQVVIKEDIFPMLPTGPSDFSVEGEVIFAGYGIRQDKYGYNDMDGINAEGKIILIMWGAPTTDDGKKYLFEGVNWSSFMSVQVKLTLLMFSKAKAVIIVPDPKSGFSSFDQQFPGISGQLNSTFSLKGQNKPVLQIPGVPKMMFVHSKVADMILEGTGHTLAELQKKIDSGPEPSSFAIEGKSVKITLTSKINELTMNNVAGIVEGSDPELKNEYVIFSAHYDHIGMSAGGINYGADDNASGTAALFSLAEAFSQPEKKPLRSLLFLWVSGEEIGLYGSQSYVDDPLVPLANTVADINIDMIGRIKGVADSTSETPMTGPDQVFIISGNQSSSLMKIAENVDKGSTVDFDYSLSGKDHHLQLFSRSDHFNFVKNDIPVLFFSTGLHSDYHTPGDVIEKINFGKMEKVTQAIYQIGYEVANTRKRIEVDNPYSKWK